MSVHSFLHTIPTLNINIQTQWRGWSGWLSMPSWRRLTIRQAGKQASPPKQKYKLCIWNNEKTETPPKQNPPKKQPAIFFRQNNKNRISLPQTTLNCQTFLSIWVFFFFSFWGHRFGFLLHLNWIGFHPSIPFQSQPSTSGMSEVEVRDGWLCSACYLCCRAGYKKTKRSKKRYFMCEIKNRK